ncbi:LacI family DNA-binding transcriptional regulator [Streptomyces montanisoli]|uniref:LacI family DNA-binding transcriptional regulator n=1 Tax=Streptomyces montanisoli TaxID=2798581 RepID=A0A940RY44_9ACTN|nr:LacI family DNA-binding transcriptional regulator [Streptomyces montanisoli]MBP0460986.1 LacI family DNA-binding transcriptional regulator [Streptomyces montanisoli]
MRDVADAVGVSVKTVSNVVNATGQVGDETARRVRAAIEELGYRPNPLARGLNARSTDMVTLALPGLGHGYCAQLAAEVFALAEADGVSVVMEPTGGDRERELEVLRNRGGLSDGVLLMPASVTARDLEGLAFPAPAVMLGPRRVRGPFDGVASRDADAAESAVRLLLDRGAERIVLLGGEREPGGDSPAALRSAGYRRALAAAGREAAPDLVAGTAASSREDGHAAIRGLLDDGVRFDAVLALEDPLAHGALHALRAAGFGVPRQVRVAAFSNDDDAAYSVPGLTTVTADIRSMARRALDLLASRVLNSAGPRFHVDVPFTIIERESTFSYA